MNGTCQPLYKYGSELRTLIEKSCNGDLTEVESNRLNDLLRADLDARLFYVSYTSIHARLSWEFGPRTPPSKEVTPIVTARPPVEARRRRWVAAAAAAIVASAAVVLAVLFIDLTPEVAEVTPQPAATEPPAPTEPPAVAPPPKTKPTRLAVLTGRTDPQATAAPLAIGDALPENRLKTTAGVNEVTFADGTVVLLDGPGELEVRGPAHGFLHVGKAVVRIGNNSDEFVLETASVTVRDLGTEFAVEVAASGKTEVQVFDGAVAAAVKVGDQTLPELKIEAGNAIAVALPSENSPRETTDRIDPKLAVRQIAFTPERFVRKLPDPDLVAIAPEPIADEPIAMVPAVESLLPETPAPKEPTEPAVPPDAALWLTFDEETLAKQGGKTVVRDQTGHGNDLTAYECTWNTPGIRGRGCKLDGNDDYLTGDESPTLDIQGPMTVSMWVNFDEWDDEGGLCGNVAPDSGSWQIDMQGKRVRVARGNDKRTEAVSTEPIEPGQWYHIAAVFDDTVFDGTNLRLYTNLNESLGKPVEATSPTGNPIERRLLLGMRRSSDTRFARIAGTVDEVGIWPRALSLEELKLLHARREAE